MAEPDDHCRVWRENKERASSYAQQFARDPAWEIVFLFYAGLHLTDAYLLTKVARFHGGASHQKRREAMRLAPELKKNFLAAYYSLKDLSESVRYDPGFVARQQDFQKASGHLGTVESFLISKLTTALGHHPGSV